MITKKYAIQFFCGSEALSNGMFISKAEYDKNVKMLEAKVSYDLDNMADDEDIEDYKVCKQYIEIDKPTHIIKKTRYSYEGAYVYLIIYECKEGYYVKSKKEMEEDV